jgi:hypothetical protein
MNSSGQLYFTRNGTTIGATSSNSLTGGVWSYIEFKALFGLSSNGTCSVYVNGVNWVTSTGVTNCTTTAIGGQVLFGTPVNAVNYAADFYVLDTSGGPFSITTVSNASAGATAYNGTITGGASNAYVGNWFICSGFAQSANNGTFKCTASTTGVLTLANASGVSDTTGTATATGNITFLGDVSIQEVYPNGSGVNSAWSQGLGSSVPASTPPPPPFSITSVANASGGTTVYTGTITGGATETNSYAGYYFTTSLFAHSANNGTFLCTASTSSTLTLANAAGVSDTTGSAAFENICQIGIEGSQQYGFSTTNAGTRPNGDIAYIYSSTTNQISDFAHQALANTGTLYGVVHTTYARKDDAGARTIAQVCLSSSTTEQSSNIALGASYQYYQDVLEMDPNTSAQWTVANFNNATFGVIEVT